MAELNTGVDKLLELVKSKKKISIAQASSILKQKPDLVREWADFLEDENKIYIDSGFSVDILLDADYAAQQMPKKFKLIAKPVEQAKPVLIKSDLKKNPDIKIIDEYSYKFKDINIDVVVMKKKGEFVLLYDLFVSSISATTEFVLEKIRQELVDKISLGFSDITDKKKSRFIEKEIKIHRG